MSFTEVLAELAVNLRLDSSQFATGTSRAVASTKKLESGLGGIPKSVSAVTSAIGGLAGGFASGLLIGGVAELGSKLVELGKGAIEHAASLHAESQQLGVTTDDLQRYRFAAGQVGIEQDKMDMVLRRLSKSIGNVANGFGGPAKKAFEALGINVRDASGHIKTAGSIIPELAAAFAKISDPATKAAFAVALFNRSGQDALPLLNRGAAGVNNLTAAADKAGVVISPALIERAHQFEVGLTKLKTQLEAKIEIGILAGVKDAGEAFDRAAKQISAFDAKLKEVTDFADNFDKRLGIPTQQQFIDSITKQFTKLHDDINADLKAVQDWAARVDKTFLGVGASVGRMVAEVGSWLDGKLHAILARVERPVKAVGDFFHNLYDRVVGHSYVPDMVDGIGAHMARLDAVMVAPAQAAADKTGAAFRDLASELGPLLDRLFPEERQALQLAHDMATLDEGLKQGALDSASWTDANQRLFGGMAVDIHSEALPALGQVEDGFANIGDVVDETRDRTSRLFGALEGIGGLVDQLFGRKAGGLFSAILGAVGSVAGAFRGGGGFNIGPTEASNAAALGLPTDFFHRALGGPVVPGRTYEVGENGPEFVRFGTRGYVTPSKAANDRGVRIQVVKGDLFDVIVDRRAANVAAPMAGHAAIAGGSGAVRALDRRADRTFP